MGAFIAIGRIVAAWTLRTAGNVLAWVALESAAETFVGWALETGESGDSDAEKSLKDSINSSLKLTTGLTTDDMDRLVSTSLPYDTIAFIAENRPDALALADDMKLLTGHAIASYDEIDEKSLFQLIVIQALPALFKQARLSSEPLEVVLENFLESLKAKP